MSYKKSLEPIRSEDRDNSGEKYWKCPQCGERVGGYVITGPSEDDWSYKEQGFCSKCGQEIDWSKNSVLANLKTP